MQHNGSLICGRYEYRGGRQNPLAVITLPLLLAVASGSDHKRTGVSPIGIKAKFA